ncbi:MAG: DUF2845 domain-containing protein [Steroidobacteraceae bacterium]|nr:DUF2845 domain-containing protein [Steroidobacteraceae bacterium]MDW8259354.1 DUF2845 domain-containing protein [Gammaproteobacteria bacterium]
MTGRIIQLLIGVALLCGPASADAFRCGSRLVNEGDTRAMVVAKCGAPTDVERQSVWRRPLIWWHGRPLYIGTDLVEIPVESWVYNLGPNKLMRRVRFEDGIVVAVETLGYGYHESGAAMHRGMR